jgi:hypothetical protein
MGKAYNHLLWQAQINGFYILKINFILLKQLTETKESTLNGSFREFNLYGAIQLKIPPATTHPNKSRNPFLNGLVSK